MLSFSTCYYRKNRISITVQRHGEWNGKSRTAPKLLFHCLSKFKKKNSTSSESQSTNIFMLDNNLSLHNKLCISREFSQIEGLHIFQNCELFFFCVLCDQLCSWFTKRQRYRRILLMLQRYSYILSVDCLVLQPKCLFDKHTIKLKS